MAVNRLPSSSAGVQVRPGKAATSPRGGALEVRRTSDARSNAAGADQGLPSDPGYTVNGLRSKVAAMPSGALRSTMSHFQCASSRAGWSVV